MSVANHLMLSTKGEEDSKDDLLSALTTLAYATPVPVQPVKKKKKKLLTKEVPKTKHRSRFFYKPTSSLTEDVEVRKASIVPTALDTINGEVENRVKTYATELPPELQKHIEQVREFFIKEIAPKTLAVQGGTAQALDVVQKTINSAVDPALFAQFERMVAQARLYKMADFVVTYMGLPASVAEDLIHSVTPKKEVMFMAPNFDGERREKAPAKKKVAPNEED